MTLDAEHSIQSRAERWQLANIERGDANVVEYDLCVIEAAERNTKVCHANGMLMRFSCRKRTRIHRAKKPRKVLLSPSS